MTNPTIVTPDKTCRFNRPIGFFDSGLGGLTVVKSVKALLPRENIVYFGDTARVPYGNKSRETVLRYSIENTIFLLEKQVKVLVVACNTASAYSLEKLQQLFNMPILGVIEAGAEAALKMSRTKNIAVLGTTGTVSSAAYQKAIAAKDPSVNVHAVPCPLLVPLIEEKFANHEATRLVVREYLKILENTHIDTILLGCTHYPLLKAMIQEEAGDHIHLVDSAMTCAEAVVKLLENKDLYRKDDEKGAARYYVSDDPEKFRTLASQFLEESLDHVEATSLPLTLQ